MKKKLQNMERLCMKMQARFGEDDDLVLQLKQELSKLQENRRKSLEARSFGRRSADAANAVQALH